MLLAAGPLLVTTITREPIAVAASVFLQHLPWVLFGILFTWQVPHFLAIGWMYRDE